MKKCKVCKKEITSGSKLGFCLHCAFLGKNNPMYGKKRPDLSERNKKVNNKGKNNPNYKGGLPKCIDCGKELSQRKVKNYEPKRCQRCYLKINLFSTNNPYKNKFGKEHPSYITGKSYLPYPEQFNQILKESIRVRDNHICQNCGKLQKQELKDLNRKLSIHHIDYNKNNCNRNNLITLCHKCNMKVNRNRIFWKRLFEKFIKGLLCNLTQK